MQGLELSEKYYEAYGRPMIEEQFADIAGQTAAGLAGRGSECLGFDDEISRDHDFGPSFCIWLPRDLYNRYGARMQAAYDALPKEFMGYGARICEEQGRGRVGVLCLEDFYSDILGRDQIPHTAGEWLSMDEADLAAAVNGRVFEDRLGLFSRIRQELLDYYPREVWIRRIAQSLALTEFICESMKLVYLFNRKYAPYKKWMRRGLCGLEKFSEIGDMLDLLYQVPDPAAAWEGVKAEDYLYDLNTDDGRILIIEAVCNLFVQALNELGLSAVHFVTQYVIRRTNTNMIRTVINCM